MTEETQPQAGPGPETPVALTQTQKQAIATALASIGPFGYAFYLAWVEAQIAAGNIDVMKALADYIATHP